MPLPLAHPNHNRQLLYAPLVALLDNEIKRTRFLLLLFPEEVAKGCPAVIAAGKKLAESN